MCLIHRLLNEEADNGMIMDISTINKMVNNDIFFGNFQKEISTVFEIIGNNNVNNTLLQIGDVPTYDSYKTL